MSTMENDEYVVTTYGKSGKPVRVYRTPGYRDGFGRYITPEYLVSPDRETGEVDCRYWEEKTGRKYWLTSLWEWEAAE